MSMFDEGDDEQLDLVLKEAARLAAQMRSVSTGSSGGHGSVDSEIEDCDDALLDSIDTSKEAFDNSLRVDIPDQTQHDDEPSDSLNASENVLERASLQTPVNSSTPNSNARDIDAAIRASEEMARALLALGAISSENNSNSTYSSIPIQSASSTGHESFDAIYLSAAKGIASDEAASTNETDFSAPSAKDNKLSSIDTGDRVSEQEQTSNASLPLIDQTGLPSESSDYHSEKNGDPSSHSHSAALFPSSEEIDGVASPWKFFSQGLSASPTNDPSSSAASTLKNSAVASSTDNFDVMRTHPYTGKESVKESSSEPVQTSKSQELKEKLRQTEAEFAMLKARNNPEPLLNEAAVDETPNWLKIATLSTPGASLVGLDQMKWEKIEEPKDGDEDYVPLKDYSAVYTTKEEEEKLPEPENSFSYSELKWTKVELANAEDDDYVPLRGYVSEPAKTKGTPTNPLPSHYGVQVTKSSHVAQGDRLGVPMKDLTKMSAQKLRTPVNVTWEKVDFANQGDDDYVPLKDYSKPSATPISSSSSNSTLSPTVLQFNDEEEFEMTISSSRRGNFENEGPTAFELNRRDKKRHKKMIRSAKAVVALLIILGAAYAYYVSTSRTRALKRPYYKSRASHRSHPPRSRKEQAAHPPMIQPQTKERILSQNQREQAEHGSYDYVAPTEVVEQQKQQERAGSQNHVHTSEAATGQGQHEETCHEAKRHKRLDNLLQSMFQ
ncbi:hypothetical protein ACA910_010719 [Epithemia clementina (nom. ined.)]